MSALSLTYLDKMGITSWRSSLPNAPLVYEIFSLYRDHKPVGRLWFETGNFPEDRRTEVMQLLDAMLTAVQLTRRSLAVNAPWDRLHLMMGENLGKQLLATDFSVTKLRENNLHSGILGSKILVTYHPWMLLNQPEDKAKAWQDLRKLKGMESINY
ncbi:MAG: hypothetical protein QM752_01310 [Gammaproteobacteria bacterium]